ncbi:MAG: alpha/beta hydrolase [Pseudomonadota bacterium]
MNAPKIEKGYARCRDGQIHYYAAGPQSAPTICFFHQTASSGAMFAKLIERLAGAYRCYAFDSPGFGQSYQPDMIPDIAFLGERLMEAIDALGVDRFHACGHHTGGCAALEMVVRHPDRFASLSIIGPVLANEEEKAEYRKTFVQPFSIEPSGDYLKTAWEYLRMIGAGGNVELHNREMADHLVAHRTMPMAFAAVWNQDVEGLFKKVSVPLMIMCSKDDVLWPLFERAGEMRPDAERCVVGGGDFAPDNDPDGVAAGLEAFWREHPISG